MNSLRSNKIEVEAVERGLDHGVWASFKVAFDPEEDPLNVSERTTCAGVPFLF